MARRPPLLLLVVVMGLGLALGSEVDLHKRIINGRVCRPNERLYHVQLEIYDGVRFNLCGGSLIRPEWILTAAHCADNAQIINAVLGVHPNPARGAAVQIRTTPVIYSENGRNHDIMLLKLDPPAPARFPTIDLANCQYPLRRGARVQAAGHGPTRILAHNLRDTEPVYQLHCAEFEVVGCGGLRQLLQQPRYQNHRHKLNEHWLCAQDPQQPPSVDTCKGDSGGGVVDTATRRLYGVLSFNSDPRYACTGPVAFMDVCAYRDWIDGITGPPPLPPRPGRLGPPPLPPRSGQPGPSSGQVQGAPRRKKSRWGPAVRN